MSEELKLLQKIFDMIEYGYLALAQYPKYEKFGFVTDIKHIMDDMICLVPSKEMAWDIVGQTDDFMQERLGLQFNEKTAVIPVGNNIEFIGRIVSPKQITLRKSTTLQMKRHISYVMEHYSSGELPQEYCLNVFTSYLRLMKHCDCKALKDKVLRDFKLVRHYDNNDSST